LSLYYDLILHHDDECVLSLLCANHFEDSWPNHDLCCVNNCLDCLWMKLDILSDIFQIPVDIYIVIWIFHNLISCCCLSSTLFHFLRLNFSISDLGLPLFLTWSLCWTFRSARYQYQSHVYQNMNSPIVCVSNGRSPSVIMNQDYFL
jgi:hypothetical protein